MLRAKVCIELLFFDICFSDTFTLGSVHPAPRRHGHQRPGRPAHRARQPCHACARATPPTRMSPCARTPQGSTGPVLSRRRSAGLGATPRPARAAAAHASAAPRCGTPQQVDATSPAAAPPSSTGSHPGLPRAHRRPGADPARVRTAHRRAAARPHRPHRRPRQPGHRPDHPPDPAARQGTDHPHPDHLPDLGGHRRCPRPGRRRRHRPVTPLIGVSEESWSITDTVTGLTHTGLTGAQARQLATLAPATARPVATPAPDRLPHLAF